MMRSTHREASMSSLPFKSSSSLSLGVELELQIVSPYSQNLVSGAKTLIQAIQTSPYHKKIKPEITQSMIELNSSIHSSAKSMQKELTEMQVFLVEEAKKLGMRICGGGTHPYQKWSFCKIFPNPRFKKISDRFQYLCKRGTVFGQHIHIGCQNGDEAIYLTHALARYVPQLIALSASSPFFEGKDSGYHSTRTTLFPSFPLSGIIPYLTNWQEFSVYFEKMRKLKIAKTMKDFYWDLRPKPEFGTVEIRVCDVPLTLEKAIQLVAYVQTLCCYLLTERPAILSPDLYYLYGYNRFQAARYGFEGLIIRPETLVSETIENDIISTLDKIEPYGRLLKNTAYLVKLQEAVIKKENDALLLRQLESKLGSLSKVVKEQCALWGGAITSKEELC